MRKNYILLAFLLAILKAHSQPILNSTVAPHAGTAIEIFNQVDAPLSQGSGGANQVWDFSTLLSPDPGQVFEYLDPISTPYDDDFPSANLASQNLDFGGNTIYNYFYLDNDVYRYWGYESEDNSFLFENELDYLHFPFTYSNQFNDTYLGIGNGDTMKGTIQVVADGYGTLLLPSGTFYNCLRLQEARRDTTISDGEIIFQSNDTFYHYYVLNFPEPLCQVVYHHALFDGTPFDFKGINWQNAEPIGIHDPEDNALINLYPDPASTFIHITCRGISFSQFTIHDYSGKTVNKDDFHDTIDIGNLSPGIYFLFLEDRVNAVSSTLKFVKQ